MDVFTITKVVKGYNSMYYKNVEVKRGMSDVGFIHPMCFIFLNHPTIYCIFVFSRIKLRFTGH